MCPGRRGALKTSQKIYARMRLRKTDIVHARTFAAVPVGRLFWYENANGLVEIAVNQGSAAQVLGAAIGDAVHIV